MPGCVVDPAANAGNVAANAGDAAATSNDIDAAVAAIADDADEEVSTMPSDGAEPGTEAGTEANKVEAEIDMAKLMTGIMGKLSKGEPIKMVVDIKNPEIMTSGSARSIVAGR